MKEEQRIVPYPFGFQLGHDGADCVVHALAHGEQRVSVGVAGGELGDLIGGGLQRGVDGVEGK